MTLCMLLAFFVWARSEARSLVQLALAFEQSLIRAQHKLRLTMQHVYGHGGNLGNECADHTAALGTFGLISNHNVATRWTRHNFDSSVCFDDCNNISEILEGLQHIRRNATTFHQDRVSVGSSHRVVCVQCAPYVCSCHVFHLLSVFVFVCLLWIIAFPTTYGLTFFIPVYCTEILRLLRAQYVEFSLSIALTRAREWISSTLHLVDLDLAKIALSCRFALD